MTWREAEQAMERGAAVRRAVWRPHVAVQMTAGGFLKYTNRQAEYWPSLEATKATDWAEVSLEDG